MKKLIIALLFSPIAAYSQQCIPGDFGGVGTNMYIYKMSSTWCVSWMCPVLQPSKQIFLARVTMPLNVIPVKNKEVKAIVPDSAEAVIKVWKELLITDRVEDQYSCSAYMDDPEQEALKISSDRED